MWLGRATARGRDGRERGGTDGRGLVLPGDGPSRPSPPRLRGRRQRAASARASRGRGRPRGNAVPRRRTPLPSRRSAEGWRRFPSCDRERGAAVRQGRGGAERLVERASRQLTTRRGVLPRARRRVPRQRGVGVACKVPVHGSERCAPVWDGVGQGGGATRAHLPCGVEGVNHGGHPRRRALHKPPTAVPVYSSALPDPFPVAVLRSPRAAGAKCPTQSRGAFRSTVHLRVAPSPAPHPPRPSPLCIRHHGCASPLGAWPGHRHPSCGHRPGAVGCGALVSHPPQGAHVRDSLPSWRHAVHQPVQLHGPVPDAGAA